MNAIKAILLALLGAWLLLGTRFAANHHLTAEELERDAERALAFERREWTAVEGEAPKSGWDAAATPRRRAARASCDASSSRTEPSPLPDLAEASGGQLEDWSDLWDVHSKVYAPSTRQTANPILIRPLLCSPGCLTQAQGQAKPERAPDLAARVLHQRTRSPAK